DFIDLGAYSSKPSAEFFSEEEEIFRIIPVIELLLNTFPDLYLSIDTFRAGVAKVSVEAGAAVINDISAGLLDQEMIATVADLQVPYIMMHMRGNPKTMQSMTDYEDVLVEIRKYFSERVAVARQAKINDIILDPGFGFAKTLS